MLSREMKLKVRQHLKLARGLLDTAVVELEDSEFEERNALSRAYYGLFHACCGWLVTKFGIVDKLGHQALQDEMHRRRGKNFGDFVRDIRGMRRAADYREDWEPQTLVTQDRLRKVRQEVLKLILETEAELGSSADELE